MVEERGGLTGSVFVGFFVYLISDGERERRGWQKVGKKVFLFIQEKEYGRHFGTTV